MRIDVLVDCLNCGCDCAPEHSFCDTCERAIQSVECFECGGEFRSERDSSVCDTCIELISINRAHA